MFERLAFERGAILFDPERVEDPDASLFDRERWRSKHALIEEPGGRGSIHYIQDGKRSWALRRYRRGGMAAHFARERYLFLGEDRTRSFRELRLLAELRSLGLPVPVPLAAGYERGTFTYVAELITERIAGSSSLGDCLRAGRMDEARWTAVGHCLRRFHDAGVEHADLNAHNILLGRYGEVWVLDFDRGRLRRPGRWRERVLDRLARSLAKISAGQYEWRPGFGRLRAAHDG